MQAEQGGKPSNIERKARKGAEDQSEDRKGPGNYPLAEAYRESEELVAAAMPKRSKSMRTRTRQDPISSSSPARWKPIAKPSKTRPPSSSVQTLNTSGFSSSANRHHDSPTISPDHGSISMRSPAGFWVGQHQLNAQAYRCGKAHRTGSAILGWAPPGWPSFKVRGRGKRQWRLSPYRWKLLEP